MQRMPSARKTAFRLMLVLVLMLAVSNANSATDQWKRGREEEVKARKDRINVWMNGSLELIASGAQIERFPKSPAHNTSSGLPWLQSQ